MKAFNIIEEIKISQQTLSSIALSDSKQQNQAGQNKGEVNQLFSLANCLGLFIINFIFAGI